MRHGDDQPLGPPEIEHQHCEAAREQGDREQSGESGERLVERPAEHRGNRRDVQRARGRDDEEHRKHMRQPPDDAVAHPGNDMAIVLHRPGRAEARKYQDAEQGEQRREASAAAVDLAVLGACHRYRPW